ncbi:GDP-mannose 4,6-dehydratase [Patescibacteria group bacterium]|nr:GDP-mannose 4,6-dehydratase [Patescibacteria group bacterium]
MKPVVFITGITGQDGSYLAEFLLAKQYQVVGLVSHKHNIGWQNIESFKQQLILEPGDLLDKNSLEKIIKKFKPTEIYNLAGLTFVPASWDNPTLTLDINTLGTSRLLEVIRDFSPQTKFYQATSAKIFGLPKESPQTEKTPLNPVDPYSISKAASHYLVRDFRNHFGIFAVSGILYNHESERRGEEFVTRKITQTAAKIKLGLADKLTLGSLDSQQDWGYAPDYVEAMWLMLQQSKPDDYIIASGKLHSVKDVCEIAFSYLKLDYKKFVVTDKKFVRKTEALAPVGDASKAKKILNWQPKVDFKTMIINMVENDLQLLK